MIRVYFAALICAVIFLSCIIGGHVASVKCDARIAKMNVERIDINTKVIGETNDAVLHTGVGDIRRILHEKYTIAE